MIPCKRCNVLPELREEVSKDGTVFYVYVCPVCRIRTARHRLPSQAYLHDWEPRNR